MKALPLVLTCFLLFRTDGYGAEVFSSGTLPDFTDADNFNASYCGQIGSEIPPFIVDPVWVNHTFLSGTPAAPVTVRSIEFYGYAEGIPAPTDLDFFILVDGVHTPLAIEKTEVSPPLSAFASPVYRYRVDVAPFTFSGQQVVIWAETIFPDAWYWAINETGTTGIVRTIYNDKNFTSVESTTIDASNTFILYDTFQVLSDLSAEITSISPVGGGVFELTLSGAVSMDYLFRSTSNLDFSSGSVVENLTQGNPSDPGTIGGTNDSVVTTDSNGDATVRMTLTGSTKLYVRAESS
ncbi:MAG: hypothetical protein AAGJ79_04560 [Verrucomicrobiota bacterium]